MRVGLLEREWALTLLQCTFRSPFDVVQAKIRVHETVGSRQLLKWVLLDSSSGLSVFVSLHTPRTGYLGLYAVGCTLQRKPTSCHH